jgi:uncharacterized integral membrane protein
VSDSEPIFVTCKWKCLFIILCFLVLVVLSVVQNQDNLTLSYLDSVLSFVP